MFKTLLSSLAFLWFLNLGIPLAVADEIYTFVVKKQAEKAKSRWSLSEWLETRDRMRLMDLWLALHSPSPYEFFLNLGYTRGDRRLDGLESSGQGVNASFAAFVSIFGLEYQVDTLFRTRSFQMFDLRIFGFHDQGTNITLQLGTSNFKSTLVGARISLYLNKFFGVNGYYRYQIFSEVPDTTGSELSHPMFGLGGFLDYSFLRIYGTYQVETLRWVNQSGRDTGTRFGIQFYF